MVPGMRPASAYPTEGTEGPLLAICYYLVLDVISVTDGVCHNMTIVEPTTMQQIFSTHFFGLRGNT
jgi:hypothetical protein